MSEEHPAGGAGPGRPRDDSIDHRVLSLTRELLIEVGWDRLSLRVIAARTGVSRASLVRRWPSKAELVLNAILGQAPDVSAVPETDPARLVDWIVRSSYELFARSDVQAAVPGLLIALRANPALRTQLWSRFSEPAAGLFTGGDSAAGAVAPSDLDVRSVLVMAAGAALFLNTIAADEPQEVVVERIAATLTAALRDRG